MISSQIGPTMPPVRPILRLLFALCLLPTACNKTEPAGTDSGKPKQMIKPSEFSQSGPDTYSFAEPENVFTTHLELDLDVSFESKVITGTATHTIEKKKPESPFVVDTRDLTITKVTQSNNGKDFQEASFTLGKPDTVRGSSLTIETSKDATAVRIHYETAPSASALQWLTPQQTADKKQPFLFTQSQSIHARSWVPLQDTPSVRITYDAKVTVPKDLLALMSAENPQKLSGDGAYSFKMKQAIPPYLLALAVGDLRFEPLGKRAGVYAEPSIIKKAAKEFEDTEKMITATEGLYGPYVWERYDIIVLPPSFPFGGMENPRLTFATPTILAGDKSLVSLVAHELAHSWSGNLVTNATWRDFWLNEGFTTYVERRIQEALYGAQQAEMEALIGFRELEEELKELPEAQQALFIEVDDESPDTLITGVPYEKGALFLRQLEKAFGRKAFDAFLQNYFTTHAFKSITTKDFVAFLDKELLAKNPEAAKTIPLKEWLTASGLPKDPSLPQTDALTAVEKEVAALSEHSNPKLELLSYPSWNTHERLHFLRSLPEKSPQTLLSALDKQFNLSTSQNSEVLNQWLTMCAYAKYEPCYPYVEKFLKNIGRTKFLRPLYGALLETGQKDLATRLFKESKASYHPLSVAAIERLFEKHK